VPSIFSSPTMPGSFAPTQPTCGCATGALHFSNSKAHLCREGTPLSNASDNGTDSEDEDWPVYLRPWSFAHKSSRRRTARCNRYPRRKHFPKPVFVQSPWWHLEDAIRTKSGFLGHPKHLCETPPIPIGATSAEQLEILQRAGYQLVKQHK
jgi:hypothetical protein